MSHTHFVVFVFESAMSYLSQFKKIISGITKTILGDEQDVLPFKMNHNSIIESDVTSPKNHLIF